ncbi:amidase [Corynebacterium striatum]|uniref:amidase n=1 Tax=Corynebacterium striatum TaxID=43770 RepID=UPI001419BB38|nr:amidase [Corynebacterium striatum]NHY10741.1 amidase [Corynebacterium striatum]NHY35068.1 amidase [Corynebacterium striatum]HAT1131616.1 amidase [Corynebacterium striatum]HAT1139677.1 amidase [Corynebacterium striatum]HAT1143108.1 amidase [Corynebacterium striatum]
MEFTLEKLRESVSSLSAEEHGFTHLDLDRRPQTQGRLSGWILSAKDLNDVVGMPTTLGHKARTYFPDVTDPFIADLEAQGALFIGKSAAPELGLRVDTEPVGLPHPDNPLYPGHTPGGSSGGAAVQVARGLLQAAHASDGGGSIRVPAAACGVVGFKPAGEDLSVQGFITRTLADAAFLHGLTPRTPRARIGVLTQPLFADVEIAPHMLHAVKEATTALEAQGFETVAISPYPQAAETFETFQRLFMWRLATLPDAAGYTDWVRQRGKLISKEEHTAARLHAAALPELLAQYWQVDAVLSPMLAYDPPRRGTFLSLEHQENFDEQTRWSPWGSLFNVAKLPAVSIPWPVRDHPPVGVQLGSITLDDAELLGLAKALHR